MSAAETSAFLLMAGGAVWLIVGIIGLLSRDETLAPVDRDGAGGGKGRPGHSDLTDASHRFRVGERVIFHSAATLPQFSGHMWWSGCFPIRVPG